MIHIVTDTAVSLPNYLINQYQITIVSGHLQFPGEEMVLVYPSLSNEAFYQRLSQSDEIPDFFEPTTAAFQMAYQNILAEDPEAEILSIHLSEKLSTTVESVRMAISAYPEGQIYLFETNSVAIGQGLMVAEAARMVQEGRSAGEIRVRLKTMREHTRVFVLLDTIKYLAHSGRVSQAQQWLGGMLGLKPVLALRNGMLEPFEQPLRSREKAIARLRELAITETKGSHELRLAIGHALCDEEARALGEELAAALDSDSVLFCELSPSLGAHTGPGAIGVGWYAPWEGRD